MRRSTSAANFAYSPAYEQQEANLNGRFDYNSLANYLANAPRRYQQTFATGDTRYQGSVRGLEMFASGKLPLSKKLTMTAGLRWAGQWNPQPQHPNPAIATTTQHSIRPDPVAAATWICVDAAAEDCCQGLFRTLRRADAGDHLSPSRRRQRARDRRCGQLLRSSDTRTGGGRPTLTSLPPRGTDDSCGTGRRDCPRVPQSRVRCRLQAQSNRRSGPSSRCLPVTCTAAHGGCNVASTKIFILRHRIRQDFRSFRLPGQIRRLEGSSSMNPRRTPTITACCCRASRRSAAGRSSPSTTRSLRLMMMTRIRAHTASTLRSIRLIRNSSAHFHCRISAMC